jgi:ABC-type phosphate transport system substrate-binding protein
MNLTTLLRSAACLVIATALAAADVQVIGSPEKTGVKLDKAEVEALFTGRNPKWPDGTKATIVVLKGGPAHEAFLRDFTGKNPSQFIATWKKLVFTGKAAMPTEVADEAAMLALVRATPGAIGYIAAATAAEGVQVVSSP